MQRSEQNGTRTSTRSLLAAAEALKLEGNFDAAADQYLVALKRDASAAPAYNELGIIRLEQGRQAEAIQLFQRAIAIAPKFRFAFQNLLFATMCADGVPARAVYELHRAFAARFEAPRLSKATEHANVPDPDRILRIGYLSPDLRAHVVGRFMEPIFDKYDLLQFEVHCYACGPSADHYSRQLERMVDRWRDVSRLSEEAIAALIREDGVDILVDLCGHSPGNRVLTLVEKPAPVQVSYLDYVATTGLDSVDYRLSTGLLDPPGIADSLYSEKLIRLRTSYWAYNPPSEAPIGELPARRSGRVTFGSFNSFCRVTPQVLQLWCRILAAVPGSRILMLGVPAGSATRELLEVLERAGVQSDRVLVYPIVPYEKYLQLSGEVDIALAPFPYNGASTTMDCLWSGLPIVAMRGDESCHSRLGASVLEATGLNKLIAADTTGYERVAIGLASSLEELQILRTQLRGHVERSGLRDHTGLVRDLEEAYRAMWRAWCGTRPSP